MQQASGAGKREQVTISFGAKKSGPECFEPVLNYDVEVKWKHLTAFNYDDKNNNR